MSRIYYDVHEINLVECLQKIRPKFLEYASSKAAALELIELNEQFISNILTQNNIDPKNFEGLQFIIKDKEPYVEHYPTFLLFKILISDPDDIPSILKYQDEDIDHPEERDFQVMVRNLIIPNLVNSELAIEEHIEKVREWETSFNKRPDFEDGKAPYNTLTFSREVKTPARRKALDFLTKSLSDFIRKQLEDLLEGDLPVGTIINIPSHANSFMLRFYKLNSRGYFSEVLNEDLAQFMSDVFTFNGTKKSPSYLKSTLKGNNHTKDNSLIDSQFDKFKFKNLKKLQ